MSPKGTPRRDHRFHPQNRWRVLRDRMGVTQDELAARLGMSTDTVYRVEAGIQQPKRPYIMALLSIAASLGVTD